MEKEQIKKIETDLEKIIETDDKTDEEIEKTNALLSVLIESMIKTITDKS